MIIFYDASCPLCNAEMQKLKIADKQNKITLEDLNAADFNNRFPNISKLKAMNLLHAQAASGEMIYGLDVTYEAWKTVGKHRWLIVLRLPVIKFFADMGYTFFAKHRQRISRLIMPNSTCSNNQCSSKK
ncbi:MAG TPA: cell division protein [Oceanospirillales bacterium]|jgi:predicted DCC family thiol-disulfide oxidoreductase YuxK|nr:cell division protein [Oceanospirillales bacterium]|tara:strand:+ start:4352 stop:4738 length:387 start_codon:yes stop_codon:yes gene_type:complete